MESANVGFPWELTEYERQRQPHEIITDNTEIAVSPKSLNAELTCPICLDMLKNTMTAKECLHRFCNDCITTALRSVNKECPTCRKKLVSRRSLRPDHNFDSLIAKICPNRAEYDAQQEKALAKLSKLNSTAALQKSIEDGIREQAQVRKHVNRKAKAEERQRLKMRTQKSETVATGEQSGTPSGLKTPSSEVKTAPASLEPGAPGFGSRAPSAASNPSSSAGPSDMKRPSQPSRESSVGPAPSEASAASASSTKQEVELVLVPHPDLSESEACDAIMRNRRYLKTSANATVEHVSRYLSVRIQLDGQGGDSSQSDGGSSSKKAKLDPSAGGPDTTNPLTQFELFVSSPPKSANNSSQKSSSDIPSDTVYTPLDRSVSLDRVLHQHWKSSRRPLTLHFRLMEEKEGTTESDEIKKEEPDEDTKE